MFHEKGEVMSQTISSHIDPRNNTQMFWNAILEHPQYVFPRVRIGMNGSQASQHDGRINNSIFLWVFVGETELVSYS